MVYVGKYTPYMDAMVLMALDLRWTSNLVATLPTVIAQNGRVSGCFFFREGEGTLPLDIAQEWSLKNKRLWSSLQGMFFFLDHWSWFVGAQLGHYFFGRNRNDVFGINLMHAYKKHDIKDCHICVVIFLLWWGSFEYTVCGCFSQQNKNYAKPTPPVRQPHLENRVPPIDPPSCGTLIYS